MSILEISTSAINATAPSIIIFCLAIGAIAFTAFIFKDTISYINKKHRIIIKDENIVEPVSWNDGKDGVDATGVPYFGVAEDPVTVNMEAMTSANEVESENNSNEGIRIKDAA